LGRWQTFNLARTCTRRSHQFQGCGLPVNATHNLYEILKMNFNDIDFYERGGTCKPVYGLHLYGYWVEKTFFETAWTHALEQLPRLDWKVPQTSETICISTYWQAQQIGDRLRLGRCVKYFVDQGMLPLQVANPGKKGKKKYSRKN
jgi:hypothetical protein